MPRYKTETRPGLVALYDIRPGNGAGLFLQPRSPHGASQWLRWSTCTQQAWVQFPLVSIWIIGGSRKGIWPKLLPCASKVLSWYRYPGILVGMSEPANNRVNKIKFRRNKRRQKVVGSQGKRSGLENTYENVREMKYLQARIGKS